MSVGKMNALVDIILTAPGKDADGFAQMSTTILASVRAYKEDRHGNEAWANRAAFSTATALFRFRRIPGVDIDTTLSIVCADGRYRILSAEDVRGRGRYIEALCEKTEPSMR